MISISLCVIVKNEEEVLAGCLDSVKDIADEIVIADTGSTDRTKEIAARYTDKIYDFEWIDHFAAARNFVFSKAEMDYILWLDADDILTEKDREKLIELKASLSKEVDAVSMYYHVGFDARERSTSDTAATDSSSVKKCSAGSEPCMSILKYTETS
ncbi:TPR repeat-containing protein [Bacillus velezensis]|nr:TPR repeat-containing protein [Bacillus velezensis]